MFSYLATEIQGGNCFVMLKHLAVDTAPCSNVFFWLKKKRCMLTVRKLEHSEG